MKKIVIAIDGHSSSGKSTMAKDLAREIGYTYIDTGAMYRAVTLYCLRQGWFEGDTLREEALRAVIDDLEITFHFNPSTGRADTYLNGEDVEQEIRTMAVAEKVSLVAALGFVRKALVAKQQAMGKEKGVVMDGRDIGTNVLPDASLKIYLTASSAVRAKSDPYGRTVAAGGRRVGAGQFRYDAGRAKGLGAGAIPSGGGCVIGLMGNV